MMIEKFKNLLSQMKPLRILLAIGAFLVVILAPGAGTQANFEGFSAVTTLVIPAITPLIFLVMLLDALMNRVWLIDAKDEDRTKYTNIIKVDLLLSLMVLIVWTPYFIEIWQ